LTTQTFETWLWSLVILWAYRDLVAKPRKQRGERIGTTQQDSDSAHSFFFSEARSWADGRQCICEALGIREAPMVNFARRLKAGEEKAKEMLSFTLLSLLRKSRGDSDGD